MAAGRIVPTIVEARVTRSRVMSMYRRSSSTDVEAFNSEYCLRGLILDNWSLHGCGQCGGTFALVMQGDSAVHNGGGLSSKALWIVSGCSFKAHALAPPSVRRVRPGVFPVKGVSTQVQICYEFKGSTGSLFVSLMFSHSKAHDGGQFPYRITIVRLRDTFVEIKTLAMVYNSRLCSGILIFETQCP